MASDLAQIADAVTAAINTGSYAVAVTAVRDNTPLRTLTDLDDLDVRVAPIGRVESTLLSRSQRTRLYQVNVIVRQKLPVADDGAIANATLDPLIELMEQLDDQLDFDRLATFTSALWDHSENDPAFDEDALREQHLFVSVLAIFFTVRR